MISLSFRNKKRLFFAFIGTVVFLVAVWFLWPVTKRVELNSASQDHAITRFTTSQGLTVYFQSAPEVPMVDIKLMLDAGSLHDGQHQGVASLTNAMLDKGTVELSADVIAEELDEVGAQLYQGIGRDYASVSLRSLTKSSNLTRAVSVFTSVLSQPSFEQKQFKIQQGQQITGIRYQEQNPGYVASGKFYELLYGKHPYAQPVEGSVEKVKQLTPKQLEQFYRQHYTVEGSVLAVVGALSLSQVQSIADKVANAMEGNQRVPTQALVDPPKVLTSGQYIDFPSEQTHIYLGALGVKRGDPDYFPLYVGNQVLGGDALSRLFTEVRDKKGLAYSVYSYFLPQRVSGPFLINLQTRNSEAENALATVRETLRHYIEKGPSGDELLAAKQYITGNMPLRVSSNSDKIAYLAVIGYYQLPIDYLETFNSKIEAVTLEDIQLAFKRHIDPENMVSVVVGKKA